MNEDWLLAHTRNILDQPLKTGYQVFLQLCSELGADLQAVHKEAQLTLSVLNSSRAKGTGNISPRALERRWYESLASGTPDYTVYDGDDYLGEMWASWAFYARKYLRAVRDERITAHISPGSHVLDVGCGFGLTTVALSQMMPGTSVTATNTDTSRQTAAARRLGSAHGFTVVDNISKAGDSADVVFASEYFEHVPEPVDHLEEVLKLNPSLFIVASTYDRPSVGHFDSVGYKVHGKVVPNKSVSRIFNNVLRDHGFTKLDTGFWNNRPYCWKR
jgi:2-polyprenyl-3-methyl-5-hydroxy-6-metoxy-1,4-benzoquinol methylase